MSNNFFEYQDLDVWKENSQLAIMIYKCTKEFPKEEVFGLTSQMRRSSISIPSNIAEGCGRNSGKDRLRFYYIARGSLFELESQLFVSMQLEFINITTGKKLTEQIKNCKGILNGFIAYHRKNLN